MQLVTAAFLPLDKTPVLLWVRKREKKCKKFAATTTYVAGFPPQLAAGFTGGRAMDGEVLMAL